MRRTQLVRLLAVLLLALVVVTMGSAEAQEPSRALRVEAEAEGSTTTTAHSTSGSAASGDVSTSAETTHEKKEKGPATSSFTGPLIAGALAIVLIGGVVKFRQKSSASQ